MLVAGQVSEVPVAAHAANSALTDLEGFDPQKARVVELRYFAGLSIPETAEAMDLSPTTIKREWAIDSASSRHWCTCSRTATGWRGRSGKRN